jgi:pyruvate dehydrogenase E2 component (dihydrolipoamide acetyltransferase)
MYNFKFADIGEGIHEGQILKWLFKVGDEVKDGDTLCIIETDKVNAEIPSPVDGKIADIMFNVGDTVHVGEVLVKIDDGTGEGATTADETKSTDDVQMMSDNTNESISENDGESAGVIGELEVSSEVIESSTETSKTKSGNQNKKVLATPVARQLAKDLGIDINTIKGSGLVGRVMKEDIYKAKESQVNEKETRPSGPSVEVPKMNVTGQVERVPLSKLRKTISKNMTLSKQIIPHAGTMDEFDLTKLVEFRKDHKHLAEEKGIKLTFMPFIIKAVTLALKEYPIFNASYDHEKEEIIYKKFYNLGIAVDTPEGLIVPVIKDADQKSIFAIAKELDEIASAARERSLSLDQLQNGTFSITNYGAFGSSYGVPVIKYPEVAILGVGMIEKKPVVVDNEIVIRDIMAISISIDHRVIDGGDAGRFLMKLKELLNDPYLLLMN